MKRGAWFGLTLMAMVVLAVIIGMPPIAEITNGHLGLLMLALALIGVAGQVWLQRLGGPPTPPPQRVTPR